MGNWNAITRLALRLSITVATTYTMAGLLVGGYYGYPGYAYYPYSYA
jgi:hypothetical protein